MAYELHSTGSYYFFVSLIVPNQARILTARLPHLSFRNLDAYIYEIQSWKHGTKAYSFEK